MVRAVRKAPPAPSISSTWGGMVALLTGWWVSRQHMLANVLASCAPSLFAPRHKPRPSTSSQPSSSSSCPRSCSPTSRRRSCCCLCDRSGNVTGLQGSAESTSLASQRASGRCAPRADGLRSPVLLAGGCPAGEGSARGSERWQRANTTQARRAWLRPQTARARPHVELHGLCSGSRATERRQQSRMWL